MTFKHINFSDSPVMRELERIAKAKGEVNAPPSVESVVKKVAASKKKASYEPGEDLMQDILKLADGLRARGFDKQADSLETKFFDYKKAETHLYRAIDEDGEDVIDFAHPHAAKPISNSEHAKVPNILERHKKIVEVVNKQPTGKYAADVAGIMKDAEEILGLKKKAQIPDLVVPGVSAIAANPAAIATLGWGMAAVALVAGGYLTYEYFVYNEEDLLDAGKKLAAEFDQEVDIEITILSPVDETAALITQKFKDLMVEIEKNYKERNPEQLFDLLKKTEEARNLAARISTLFAGHRRSVHKLAQNFVDVADNTTRFWQQMLRAKIDELKEVNPEEYKKVTQIIAQPEAKKILDDFSKKFPGVSQDKLHADIVAQYAKQLNDLAAYSYKIGDNNLYKAFKNYASIFADPKVLEAPYAQILFNLQRMGLKNIEQLKTPNDFKTKYIDAWLKYFKQQKLSSSSNIFRKAQNASMPPEVVSQPNTSAPASLDPSGFAPSAPAAATSAPAAATPAAVTAPATQRRSPDAQEPEKSAVQRMQMALNNLGMRWVNDHQYKAVANILIATGPRGADTIDQFDGKWGPNTDRAVRTAAEFGISLTPGATYSSKPKTQEQINAAAQKADENLNVIIQYMKNNKISVPDALKNKNKYEVLDSVKKGSTVDDSWVTEEEYEGSEAIPLTIANLLSFSSLNKWIKSSGLSGEGFEEAPAQQPQPQAQYTIQEIVDPWAQQTSEKAALQRGVPAAKVNSFIQSVKLLKSAQAAATGRTKSRWTEVLQRFYARASTQLQLATAADDENTARIKTLYVNYIRNLFIKLQKGTANLSDNQVISAYDLDFKLQQQSQDNISASPGQLKPGQQAQIGEGSEFDVERQRVLDHPLGDVINLWALQKVYGHVMTYMSDYAGKLTQGSYLDIESLNDAPLQFANQFLKTLDLSDVKKLFLSRKISKQQRAEIIRMTQGSPTYMKYVGMAKLLIVMDVLSKLRADLNGIPSAVEAAVRNQESNSNAKRRVSPRAIQEAMQGWAKWNARISQMIQRINSEYQSLSAGVSQISRNEPV
jgi:hypothetical protein